MPKPSVVIHLDSLNVLDHLTKEQAGELLFAFRDYMNSKEPNLDFAMKMAYIPFCNQFNRDNEAYQKVVDRNRSNGASGGRPTSSENNPEKPKKPTGLSGNPTEPKKPDNDNDNDNDNDKEKEKEKDSKKEKDIPTLEVFLEYYQKELSKEFPNRDFAVQAKYESWIDQKWKDGNGNKIVNWKSKLKNTIGHLPEKKGSGAIPLFQQPKTRPESVHEHNTRKLLELEQRRNGINSSNIQTLDVPYSDA